MSVKGAIMAVVFWSALIAGGYFAVDFWWYTYKYPDEWIYTWWETYPELKPLSLKILADGKITIAERKEFNQAIERVQATDKEKQIQKSKDKLNSLK